MTEPPNLSLIPTILKILDHTTALTIRYGAEAASSEEVEGGLDIQIPVPILAGNATDSLPIGVGPISVESDSATMESGGQKVIFAKVPLGDNLAQASREIYETLFRAVGDHHLYRICNYLPGINHCPGSLEVYRQFNIGRWLAFENAFGPRHEIHMPAASAVGARGDELILLAIAGTQLPRYLENPDQVPAYQYPTEHGPRAPGFARATVVQTSEQNRLAYLSGTASILGHATVGTEDLKLQFDTTMANVATMLQRMDFPKPCGSSSKLKCYLRNAGDLDKVLELFEENELIQSPEDILFLEADICRAELDLEFEGIFAADNA